MLKNSELDLAFDFVQYTNRNIFLTGKAGTGKTTFLRSLKDKIHKRMVVVAPTGVAAINAGGVTIHSFFQLPFGPVITERVAGKKVMNVDFQQKYQKHKINIFKSLELLIIDEISMVRADILDAIDDVLRRYKNRFLPFGGVQVLMIGDMQQLPPVVKRDEWDLLREYYPSQSMYFFYAKVLKESELITIELKHVYRQADETFIKILNEIRDDRLTRESYDLLHKRFIPDFKHNDDDGYITLTTHNASADKINEKHLSELKGRAKKFVAKVEGNFSEYAYPTDYELKLKEGAQVMFVKNDISPEKLFYNGKIGKITLIDKDTVFVKCPGDETTIAVNQLTWENIKYSIDSKTQEIKEEQEGSFKQIPLRLAWAITIHKSQGLTFDKAIIDAHAAFAHGQTYVALSRCKTLEGMVLTSEISKSAIICDREISAFNRRVEEHQPSEDDLKKSRYKFQKDTITNLFNYKQLNYSLERLEKTIEDNIKSVHGTIRDTVMKIQRDVIPELTQISAKFIVQVESLISENPDIEKNESLIERLKKAGEYFHKQHTDRILTPLEESSFESDNKKTTRQVNENMEQVIEILSVKQAGLEVCKTKFDIEKIMEATAKAAIGKKKRKARITEFKGKSPVKHSELYKMLRFWRDEQSDIMQIPQSQILQYKTIVEIAGKLPCTMKQLKKIKGIGKIKARIYGDDIIDMVKEYIEENGLECPEDEPDIIKPVKKKNHEVSFELYKEGYSVEEIAGMTGFTTGTIQGHMARYIKTGDVPLEDFVSNDKIEKITAYFREYPDATFSQAKNHLPDEIDWGDLKLVKASF